MSRWCVVALLVLGLPACDDPTRPAAVSGLASRHADSGGPITVDDRWAKMAEGEIPGFAGHALDEDGSSVIFLVEGRPSEPARRYVERFRQARGLEERPIRVVKVRYDFSQLKTWSGVFVRLLERPEVVLVDIDERANRILVGVHSPSAAGLVHRAAAGQGVPPAAVEVRVVEAPQPRAALNPTINSRIRPIPGGVATINSVKQDCTLGFNAIYLGTWFEPDRVPGFITASHCSATTFGLDNSIQYQPTVRSIADRIGTEYLDRAKEDCHWLGFCLARGSDASFFRYDPGVTYELGYIAKTTAAGIGHIGHGWIDLVDPRFEITLTAWSEETVVGTWLNKVGAGTGWTRGQVTQTCVTLAGLVCQYVSTIYSEPGDSGAPIFQDASNSATPAGSQVTLHGLLWGGPPGNWNVTWFSHIWQISWDPGSFCVTSGC